MEEEEEEDVQEQARKDVAVGNTDGKIGRQRGGGRGRKRVMHGIQAERGANA